MSAKKVVMLVVGALAAIVTLGLLAGGGFLAWAHGTQRDADGFYRSGTETFSTDHYAVVSGPLELDGPASPGTLRLEVAGPAPRPVFVGIAASDDVEAYLSGVAYDEVQELPYGPMDLRTTVRNARGTSAPERPADQPFWVASTTGTGEQTLTWKVTDGTWRVVVMNQEATTDVTAFVSVGVRTGWVLGAAFVLFGLALVSAALATALFVGALSGPAPAPAPRPAHVSPDAYPARLDGHADLTLSRWLWLVKWLLVVPHLVVLAFLWIAFCVTTAFAGVAILFTGRYPRKLFAFNVGVIRWTWRVTFYAFVLGTDTYPPFSLASDPRYPADFDVDYPERLSRSLVLVKWWLLAIPHYVVVGIFTGGTLWIATGDAGRGDNGSLGIGLIGALVLVAGVLIAVRRRYHESILSFVMGMERWSFRVLTYAALMRDEYPPFRLDTGGTDPGTMPIAPPVPLAPPAPRVPLGPSGPA